MTIQEPREADNSQPDSYIPNPSPLDGTYATWFRPTNPAVLSYTRARLALYREQYEERAQAYRRYPFRLLTARRTGLPIFLRGFLDPPQTFTRSDDEALDPIATQWLFDDLRVGALVGLDANRASQQLRRTAQPPRVRFGERASELRVIDEADAVIQSQIEQERQEQAVPFVPQAHIPFQQWHKEWPLFGAQVVVHMTSADERTSVTSSYYPIDSDQVFKPVLTDPEPAFELAFTALRDYFYRSGLAEHSYFPFFDPDAWHFHSTPYAEQTPFILPFAGDYHLVYQIDITSFDYSQRWRVFVDCEREIVLGQPERLKLDAQYYANAADVLAVPGILQNTQFPDNPCKTYMDIGIYQAGLSSNDGPVNWGQSNSPGPHFEAANVATHATKLFNYFVNLGIAQADLEQVDQNGTVKLRARVAKPGLPELDMGFFFGEATPQQQQWINFQSDNSDNQNGLPTLATKRVHHPTYDPEVIYHELTHAFMWLMNRDAFDGVNSNIPFGRALLEGYANYFARSLAVRYEEVVGIRVASGDQPWARAAYRTDTTAQDWADRWAMARAKQDDGQDRLPIPNLYPSLDTTGLPVYDVGMIWARGMWDLRGEVPSLALDEFALGAFDYLHGWIATPELVVEGMIDVAKSAADGGEHFDKAAEEIFATRGIVANQRIQAISSLNSTVLVGADAGLLRSLDDGQTWEPEPWDEAQTVSGDPLDPLRNVVALSVEGSTFLAATETGIWQRNDGDSAWQPIGDWPSIQTPYVMDVFDGTIYVGTGNGVWWYDHAADKWRHLVSGNPDTDFVGAVLDLSFAVPAAGEKWLIVASFGEARRCNVSGSTALEWLSIPNDSGIPICSVAVRDNDLYLGTFNGGLQRFSFSNPFDPPVSDASPTAVTGAVLTLCNRPGELIAASTTALFTKDFSAPNKWDPLPLLPCATNLPPAWPGTAKILTIHRTDATTWISTATHGLWQLSGNSVCPVDGVAVLIE